MLKDENGNRVKLNSDLFYKLMKDDKRKIKDLMACIANECHVSIDAVVQWKKGKNSPGDLEFVKIIAKILVVDYKMLICEVSPNDIKENEIRKNAEFQDYIRENTIQENINAIEYKNKEKEYEKYKTEQEIENVKEEMVDISKPIIEKFSWLLLKNRLKEEQFRKGILAGVIIIISMIIIWMADQTDSFVIAWGFMIAMLWSTDYYVNNPPNIWGLNYDVAIVERKIFRGFNIFMSTTTVVYVLFTQYMMLMLC